MMKSNHIILLVCILFGLQSPIAAQSSDWVYSPYAQYLTNDTTIPPPVGEPADAALSCFRHDTIYALITPSGQLYIWLRPDPLLDKYIQSSPYAYCDGNPLKYIDPEGMDWYETNDESGNKQYIYNENIHSQTDLDQNNIVGTYMGATMEQNGIYYSLFGHQFKSNSFEGQIYMIMDDALIRKARYDKAESLAMYSSPFETDFCQSPLITFQVTGFGIKAGRKYEVEYEGGHGIFYSYDKYIKGRLVNWPGDSDMPMIISGYLSGSIQSAYHLRYSNNQGMDLIHILFDKENADLFLQKYQKQFYHQ